MAFPSPDPVWIVESLKMLAMFLIGIILLYRWFRADVRFFTDIPFLFGIAMFFAGAAEGIDFFFDSGLTESLIGLPTYILPIYQFRVSLTVFTLTLWLFASVLIWTTDRRLTGYSITIIYGLLTLAVIWLSPTIEFVRFALLPFLAIAFFVFILTFMLAWYWKRLPDVNGLIMSIGAIIALVGQIIKNPLDGMGIIWVSEFIDLVGIIILTAGLLIKPRYAR